MTIYSWFDVYRAAMLETDNRKLPNLIETARRTLKTMQTVAVSTEEQQALADALHNLYAVETHEYQTHSRERRG
jgi:hypothetical protein